MLIRTDRWRLVLGDSLDESGLSSLPDWSVDHVITDPPYGTEAHTRGLRLTRGGETIAEPLAFAPIDGEAMDAAAMQFSRVTKRWVIIFCQVEQSSDWRACLERHGLDYIRTGVWIKPDGQPQYTGDRPGMGYESIVIAHRPGRKRWNAGGKHGVWKYPKMGTDDRDRTGHQTQKPLALMESLVRDFTDPGDVICDPFAGSGTTGVAAIFHGRRFIGWERESRYHAMALKRLARTCEQLGLFAERAQ